MQRMIVGWRLTQTMGQSAARSVRPVLYHPS